MNRFRAEERAGEVGVDHAGPFLELEGLRWLSDVDAGIVDEDVDAAEFTPDAFDQARDRCLVGDVGNHRDRLDAARGKLGSRRFRLGLVAPDDSDIGAGFCKAPGDAKPDAAIASGDDGDFTFEIEQCGHGRWLCQIRIRPTAASAAP